MFVIATGPSRIPLSSSHVVPVISPLPLSVNQAPNTGSALDFPRGWTTVTPVRTGPLPTTSAPFAFDERRVADLDALQIGDGIERARLTADKRADAELAGAEPPYLLSIDSGNARDHRERDRSDDQTLKITHHRAAVLGTISICSAGSAAGT